MDCDGTSFGKFVAQPVETVDTDRRAHCLTEYDVIESYARDRLRVTEVTLGESLAVFNDQRVRRLFAIWLIGQRSPGEWSPRVFR